MGECGGGGGEGGVRNEGCSPVDIISAVLCSARRS